MTPKYVFSCSNSGFFLQLGQYFERVRYIGCRRYNRNDRILAHAVLEAIFSESLFFLAGTREWLLEDLPCESPVDECEDPNHLPNVKCHCSRCLRYRYFTLHPDFQEELVERLAQGAYADVPFVLDQIRRADKTGRVVWANSSDEHYFSLGLLNTLFKRHGLASLWEEEVSGKLVREEGELWLHVNDIPAAVRNQFLRVWNWQNQNRYNEFRLDEIKLSW